MVWILQVVVRECVWGEREEKRDRSIQDYFQFFGLNKWVNLGGGEIKSFIFNKLGLRCLKGS